MENGDEALPSIILAGRGLLIKMLITLEQHHNYNLIKLCILIHFFFKLAWKMIKKRHKNIKKKYWSRMDSSHCVRLLCYKKTS